MADERGADDMEFSQRLYELRRKAGLSQEGLADLVGVTRQAVQKWEAGNSRPDMENLAALARYFNVTLDWLITGQESGSNPIQERPVVVENHYHYSSWQYEYKSRKALFGIPLVHIKLAQRGFCVARGIIAIGNVSVGLLSVGCFSLGLISIGCGALGLLVLGCIGIGLFALGAIAVGMIALGGVAIGWLAVGASAIGTYCVGGAALASKIAVGSAVSGELLAIGREAEGAVTLGMDATREALSQAIAQADPRAPGWLQALLVWCAQH